MWSWIPGRLPAQCFISHSYQDVPAREQLLKRLPWYTKPVIFPPIHVSPEQLISNALIQAVTKCPGLIYLEGGASSQSFWVAFERDYALRMKKAVYAFSVQTHTLRRDRSAPLDLSVYLSYSLRDVDQVQHIHAFMRDERFFDTWFDRQSVNVHASQPWLEETQRELIARLHAGGYAVLFWSSYSRTSPWVENEYMMTLAQYPNQILPVLLDPTPLPAQLSHIHPLQLYDDEQRSQNQRIDDLIVCLYWLIYRNTRQSRLD